MIAGALLTGGTVAGAAIVNSGPAASPPPPVSAGVPTPEYVQRELPRHRPIRPIAKPKHHKKPVVKAASRSYARRSLTGSPQTVAHALVLQRGWSEAQFNCLVTLWTRESSWNTYAANPSGAYGIPQALPGSKMSSFGSDWRTNPVTQIRWGLWYIGAAYGSPCVALDHSYRYNYY